MYSSIGFNVYGMPGRIYSSPFFVGFITGVLYFNFPNKIPDKVSLDMASLDDRSAVVVRNLPS